MNTDNTRLFIGYFSNENKPQKIANFLAHQTPEVEKIWVIRKLIRSHQKVYCCCLQYPSERLANIATQKLNELHKPGRKLRVRRWARRTGANERRDIRWRSVEWPAEEHRSLERRNFQPLVYRYDQFFTKGGLKMEPSASVANIPVSEKVSGGAPPSLRAIKLSFISAEQVPTKHRNYFTALSFRR